MEKIMAPSAKFYIGQKIGMLTIINEEGRTNGLRRNGHVIDRTRHKTRIIKN